MELLLPMSLFAFVSSITPGPNNTMLASSGILFGFRRTVPHLFGVCAGFGTMLALSAAGIGGVVVAVPALGLLLKAVGSTYLLYFAWRLRHMTLQQTDGQRLQPMSFWNAAGFQFVNPKAWMMAVSGASAFLPQLGSGSDGIALICLVFCVVNLACISVWAAVGAALRSYLVQPVWQKTFTAVMVILTIYAAFSLWL
ncbi:threonine/homoserine/homoserine lactone efflux protein [Paucimonas lemoignei]|uniref:Threonine/homoserine/homoserine lactone efflux protein n=1 Tax=Paucimonas lemoignei TaxID=29443 RepID=A0A4R3HYP6_PAULE|nr:LysE family translocator [Paucimonas lemoignei]TCS36609.1 threonine/homoserine/homoserine lactone efflux protein [Paucimonas lemoignei]